MPIGSNKTVEVDIRLIVASNKNLEEEVKKGLFREDLFYRIDVIPIHIPPLRERKEDIPLLVRHFLKKFSYQMNKELTNLTPEAMQKLMLHNWPGNVRELENTIEYAAAITTQNVITDDLILNTKVLSSGPLKTYKKARAEFEKGYLIHLLELTKGNVSKASQLAGKYRADIYSLMKKHEINIGDFKKG